MRNAIVTFEAVEDKVILIREQKVILDSDVAALYGVETKRVNEAVKNNPDKFPGGYLLELTQQEKDEVVENFDHLKKLKYSAQLPKAFTEKGLYMIATILKSARATETTFQIIETFAKLRELTRTVGQMADTTDQPKQKSLMQKSGELFADLLDSNQHTTDSETTIELNLAVLKVKHTVKRTSETKD